MVEKIINLFKKLWWVILIPIGLFVIKVVFRKDSPELDKLIKDKQKEIKDNEKKVSHSGKEADKTEEALSDSIDRAEEVSTRIETEVEARDKKAEEFFR